MKPFAKIIAKQILLQSEAFFPELSQCFFEVHFVSKIQIQKLNADFLKKNTPTDVLSFPADGFYQKTGYLGELILCKSVLKGQAKEQGHTEETECLILMIHGFLHLLGFDHQTPLEKKKMLYWEAKLIQKCSSSPIKGLISRAQSKK
jgi:rRNA maturation RNase YbeY